MTAPRTQGLAFLLLCLCLLSFQGCSRDRACDFLTEREMAWLSERRDDLVVALDPRWGSEQDTDGTATYRGIAADILSLVERKLDIKFKLLQARTWEDVLAAEERDEIDVHLAVFRTRDRLKSWLFTDPYVRIPVVVVTKDTKKKQFSLERLRGMTMGVGHAYGLREFVAAHCSDYNIVRVESDLFGLMKVSLGELDLMLIDLASASHHIEDHGLTNLRLVARLGSLYDFSFACRKDEPVLHSILQRALRSITREERKTLYERWIRFGPPPFYESGVFWTSTVAALAIVLAVLINILLWNRALRREMDERARMAEDILQISSGERARIGRDLHDSIGQQLVGVTLLTRAIEERLRPRGEEEADLAAKVTRVVEDTIEKTRFVVQGLLPVDIVDEGLVFALEKLAADTSETTGIPCRFECRTKVRMGDNARATNVYRIAQEAVNNACKHGAATMIDIRLFVAANKGTVVVKDDGKGLPRDRESRGMGLKIMRYRADLAGGELDINSDEDKGTTVTCRFPCEEGDGEVVGDQ